MLAGESWTRDLIVQQLAGASVRNRYADRSNQIRCYGLHTCSILCWCQHVCGKRGAGYLQAAWALFLLDLVLHDPEPFDWQVNHLSALGYPSLTGEEVLMTVGTALNSMGHNLIWSLDLTQGVPLVTRLASGLFAALLAQRFGHPYKAIRGGRPATVVAVFGLLPLKRFDAFLLKGNHAFQVLDTLLEGLNGMDRLQQPLSQGLVRRLERLILLSEVV
jgi:hypothetical protein